MTSYKDKNKKANEILYAFSIIGIIPLMAILMLRINNPYSQVLYYLYNKVAFLPSITSLHDPVMTTLMSNYNKTAPVMGILVFLCTYKTREIIKPVTRKLVVQSCFWGPVFYAILIYITLFYNLELTTAGGFFKLLSHNVITLFILYCSIYFTVLTMTYAILLMPLLVIKYFKGRQ